MSKVRTNIEIEDTYVEAIMDRFGLRTKTEAVELALRHLAGQPMTREEALAMRGARAIDAPPADTGPGGARCSGLTPPPGSNMPGPPAACSAFPCLSRSRPSGRSPSRSR